MHAYNLIAEETETSGSLWVGPKKGKPLAKSLIFRPVREVLNKSKKQGVLKNKQPLASCLSSLSCVYSNLTGSLVKASQTGLERVKNGVEPNFK